MRTAKDQRIFIAALSMGFLAFTFVRCSPIAPSVSKSSLQSGGRIAATATPPSAELTKTVKPAIPISARIVKYETRLLGETSFYTLEFDPTTQTVMTISEGLSPARFEEIRTTGKTEIAIDIKVPKKITVIFRVSDEAFLNADDILAFDSNIDPLESGNWELQVSESVPKKLSEHILKHLEAVTVIFDTPATVLTEPGVTVKNEPESVTE